MGVEPGKRQGLALGGEGGGCSYPALLEAWKEVTWHISEEACFLRVITLLLSSYLAN